jgi:hypothetical protein
MSSGGTIDRLLNRIPGYGGYRDKERRRDSDRAIRDNLALEYGQLADRLGRLASRLANERQILAVGIVDKPHKQLQLFINRVRTASYGYAPLFSDAPVDAAALDQLAAFDRALADQQVTLADQISQLEAGDPKSPEFKQLTSAIQETIQGLDDRFDKRNEVLTSGKASSDRDVLALLDPPPSTGTPVAYRIHEGEALAYRGTNYTVVARVSAESEVRSVRSFQLRGGTSETWLLASTDGTEPVHWSSRVELPASETTETVIIDGQTYTLAHQLEGTGDVIGQGGVADREPVQLLQYRSESNGTVLDIFKWGSGALALAGTEVEHAEIDFFSREK